jgi:hypothetical protein
MRYIKQIRIEYDKINLILDKKVTFNDIQIKDFYKLKKRLPIEIEEIIINSLKEQLRDEIGMAYEIGNSYIYDYIRDVIQGIFLPFENLLLEYSNKNCGLKITGVPYDIHIDESTDKHYRTILDETIYNYTITNRGGNWPEIGINNKQDLLKLRKQIVDHETLQFHLKGYGDLDY